MPNLRLADMCRLAWQSSGKAIAAHKTPLLTAFSKLSDSYEEAGVERGDAVIKTLADLALPLVATVPVIVADNICDRSIRDEFDEHGTMGHELDWGKISDAAPPLQECFVEWKWPSWIEWTDNWKARNGTGPEQLAGLFISAEDLTKEHSTPSWLSHIGFPDSFLASFGAARTVGQAAGGRWLLRALGFGSDGRLTTSRYFYSAMIDPTGRVLNVNTTARPDADGMVRDNDLRNMMIAFNVFSFMNCRNIECVDTSQEFAQTEKWHRRQKLPLLKYYTLRVTQKVRKRSGSVLSDSTALTSEHICRGHYAEYTEEAPRFGRKADGVGKFWISPHTRGTKDAGQVRKDYEVDP